MEVDDNRRALAGRWAGLRVTLLPMRREETILQVNGHDLFLQRWLPDAAAPAAVVLVHGYAEHSGRYDYVGGYLSRAGFAIEAYDLRGHGRSSGSRAFVRSIDEHLEDLDAVIAEAQRRYPDAPIFLLGHSLGGGIATLYVLRRQPLLNGVVLTGPAIRGRRSAPRPVLWLFKLVGRFLPKVRLAKLAAGDVSRDPAVVEAYDNDPLVYRKGMPAGTLVAMIKAGQEMHQRLEEFGLPVLAIHGEDDVLTDPEGSRQLIERASSVDKQLSIWPGLYHEVLNEPERDEVLAVIAAWLRERSPARSEDHSPPERQPMKK